MMLNNKIGQGLPINIVVTMIIGLTIFGLGMGLYFNISGGAIKVVDDNQDEIRKKIAASECRGDDWICSPSNSIRNGGEETFEIYIANHDDIEKTFSVSLDKLVDIDSKKGITSSCGSIVILSQPNFEIKLKSGFSGTFPYIVRATKVSETPCDFISTVVLRDVSDESFEKKSVVIVNVE